MENFLPVDEQLDLLQKGAAEIIRVSDLHERLRALPPEILEGRSLDDAEFQAGRRRVLAFLGPAKRAFEAMMTMKKIDVAAIKAARRG